MKKLWFSVFAVVLASCSQSPKDGGAIEATKSGIEFANFDKSVRPQDDFYRYVNGTWLKTTKIPDDKSNYGTFTALDDNARKDMRDIIEQSASDTSAAKGSDKQKVGGLYNSFMNVELLETLGITPLNPELAAIDGLATREDLAKYFARAQRMGSDVPFGFYINNDAKAPTQYIAYFVHSGLGLPDRDFYFHDDEKSQKIRDAYVAHIEKMFVLAGFDAPKASAKRIMEIETSIADGHWTNVKRRNRDLTYNKYTIEKLPELAKDFSWQSYLAEAGLSDQDAVVIRTPDYYPKFNALFTSVELEDWKTYLRWHLLTNYAGFLNKEIDDENFAFYGKILQGTEVQQERWKRAVDTVNGLLGEMVGKVYVEKYFQPEAKARMVALVENLRQAYRESIQNLEWMGEDTKIKALEKLNKFNPKIGYPDKWRDYSNLQISDKELVGNYFRASQFNYDYDIAKLGKPVDRDEWFMTPQTVNAYYNPVMNEIVFPAAILQPPFFNMEADDAVNYGAIGAVIGHEMGHGFDDQGAKSDGDGVLQNWWTETDLMEFKQRTGKLATQYGAFEVLPGEFLNGEFTLGENIGDLGGLTIAHKAYNLSLNGKEAPEIDGFTGEQRFFIGWAQVWARKYRDENLHQRITTDPHSPSEFRTNGVVRNMPEFMSAFDVKKGDALYLPPEERVKIW
ncbi:Neutral endopeptidase [Thalassocella blandensis]|nr:Neutral endopeptidase [Thalassocella blandensis]